MPRFPARPAKPCGYAGGRARTSHPPGSSGWARRAGGREGRRRGRAGFGQL